tara:strand:- start:314 stop:508 length:195 start_codon:yes stop_codon:yes gene_type:complete
MKIKKHLEDNEVITSWEAITQYRITRLSALIFILRTEFQMEINSTWKNKDGKKWTEYRLVDTPW